MLFSLLKHYFDLYVTDTSLKVSWSLYCFTSSICHGVENYFPRLWGTASLMLFFLFGEIFHTIFILVKNQLSPGKEVKGLTQQISNLMYALNPLKHLSNKVYCILLLFYCLIFMDFYLWDFQWYIWGFLCKYSVTFNLKIFNVFQK